MQAPVIEAIGMRSHQLIRIYVDVGQEEWFGMKVVPEVGEIPPIEARTEGRGKGAEGQEHNTGGQRESQGRDTGRQSESQERDTGRQSESQERDVGRRNESQGRDTGRQSESQGQNVGSRGGSAEYSTKNAEAYDWAKRIHFGLFRGLLRLFQHRERKTEKSYQRTKEQERIRLLQERQKVLSQVEEAMHHLVSDILEMIGSWEGCFCVYEDSIRKALVFPVCMEAIFPTLWKNCFQIREFDDYTRQLWVEELLPEAVLPHFVILGTASCLPILIEKYADTMKSLRWILPENDCSQELEEFVEDFYIEYGLAIMLQLVPAGQRRLQAACTEPSNILDFTREPQVSLAKVAKGSIWLDMVSMEEKRRRIVGRSTEVAYFSLKEKWKLVRKKEPFVPEM